MQQFQPAHGELAPDERDHVDRVLAQWAHEEPELDLSGTVAVIARLGRLRAYVDRELDELFGRYQLTRQSWDVLACLRRAGKPYQLTPTEINREVMRTSGAITHTLHALEYAGLITRVPHPQDGRSSHVQLTSAGLQLLREVAPLHVDNERRMLAPLTPEELSTLASLLRKLLLAFERENPMPHARATQRARAARTSRLGSTQ